MLTIYTIQLFFTFLVTLSFVFDDSLPSVYEVMFLCSELLCFLPPLYPICLSFLLSPSLPHHYYGLKIMWFFVVIYHLFHPLYFKFIPEPCEECCDINVPVRVEHSLVSYSLHCGQLCVTINHYLLQREHFQMNTKRYIEQYV